MRAKQPVSIDGIEFDALIDETVEYSADIPNYTTEKGFEVSDNISIKPEKLSMTLFVSDTPVSWKSRFGNTAGRMEQVIKELEELFFSKKVVTVSTTDRTYTDMAITTFSIAKSSDSGYAREIPISFGKIRVAESKTVTIPASYGKAGETEKKAGRANTKKDKSSGTVAEETETTEGKSSGGSILYHVGGALGMYDTGEKTLKSNMLEKNQKNPLYVPPQI